jgi:hypothetical protein
MHIVTLFENTDREQRKALDRYLTRLSVAGLPVRVWNADQTLPGEVRDDVLHAKMAEADLILLLVSQDFWASETCDALAGEALRQSRENPEKKLAAVMLRPNSIDDTPCKDLPRFPHSERCISQYADANQGCWDVYQGIKSWLDPRHRYRRRPKINALRTLIFTAAALLLWNLFVLLLPVVYPQKGLRLTSMPVQGDSANTLAYTFYKLDNAPQKELTLSFYITFWLNPI